MEKKLQVRNSTVDFLTFTRDAGEDGVEVRVQGGQVWLTQKGIGELYGIERSVAAKHLKHIYQEKEVDEQSTCALFAQVADNGKTYHYKFYSLPAIIAVGYRTNSARATQFRQWATRVLRYLYQTRLRPGQRPPHHPLRCNEGRGKIRAMERRPRVNGAFL